MNKTTNFGKYTFLITLAIGSLIMFSAVIAKITPDWNNYVLDFAIAGYFYLFAAAAINTGIIIVLSIFCCYATEKMRKNYLIAIGWILLNIPIAAIYAYVGIYFICGQLL
ncbi:MAG: hypothetical protein LBV75_09815 [Paludibacter sp.]|jgi:hypothetical protein|nr:hypothetical protein [Paludibacter sp.]